MVSKDELLDMLDKGVSHEETLISGWRDAIIKNLPESELTDEQKEALKEIVKIQTDQSLKHKRILSKWFNQILESDRDEY